MQRVLDVFERVGRGEKFATAFEESIGLSLADFTNYLKRQEATCIESLHSSEQHLISA